MAEPVTPSAGLRLLLFGASGAGKSALLGALGQAVQTPDHAFDGQVVDATHVLSRVHPDRVPVGDKEVYSYPVGYEPIAGSDGRLEALLLDSAGASADEVLQGGAPLDDRAPAGTLEGEILRADVLILTIDASASAQQLDQAFVEFEALLRRIEHQRGRRTDVAGLPVFLVLTKCDLLARPGDTSADWMEHIEERKREVDQRFRSFLAHHRGEPNRPPPFGRINLNVWATAVRRPPLAGPQAKAQGPYGVAELFRQGLEQAAQFRDRRQRSDQRLVSMATASLAAVVFLLGTAAALVVNQALHRPPTQLELRVETLRYNDLPTPEKRLHGTITRLRERQAELQSARDDPDFARLPADLRDYVERRLDEVRRYVAWLEPLERVPPPRSALTEEDLRETEARLKGPLAQPRPDWDKTDAAALHRGLLAETDALLQGIAAIRQWYQQAYDAADAVWTFAGQPVAIDWNAWNRDAEKLLDPSHKPPFAESDRVTADASATYAVALEFETAAAARARWEGVKQRLNRVRDVGAALGFIEGIKDRPPVLVVPANGFTLEQARARAEEMQKAYPEWRAEFVLDKGLPQAVVGEVRRVSGRFYDSALQPAHDLVRQRWKAAAPGDADGPERWKAVRQWLADPRELAGWRDLAQALARLGDGAAPDPIDALTAFLDQKSFSITIDRITVVVPDDLGVKPRPDATLTVYHGPTGTAEAKPTLTFDLAGDGERVGETPFHAYTFRLSGGKPFAYTPGDLLYAALPLRDGKSFWWGESRSPQYRFEALLRGPRLLEGEQKVADGKRQDRVRLRLEPADGVPKAPDLLPEVGTPPPG